MIPMPVINAMHSYPCNPVEISGLSNYHTGLHQTHCIGAQQVTVTVSVQAKSDMGK